jgi:hypothetical protein
MRPTSPLITRSERSSGNTATAAPTATSGSSDHRAGRPTGPYVHEVDEMRGPGDHRTRERLSRTRSFISAPATSPAAEIPNN